MYVNEIACVNQLHVAQDKDQWWDFVNMVKKCQVAKRGRGISLLAEQLLASEGRLLHEDSQLVLKHIQTELCK
jgi:hypothetical protein